MAMSRGIGAVQRRVFGALIERRNNDSYAVTPAIEDFVERSVTEVRARWRWYTIDLLGVAGFHSSRSDRVSLHRAVRGLHKRGVVEISPGLPYERWFGCEVDELRGVLVGGVDLDELSDFDPRWPGDLRRSLWFRLQPRRARDFGCSDDQMWLLDNLYGDFFDDFTGAFDRKAAWGSEFGQFMRWLFCGYPVCAQCAHQLPLAGLPERLCGECGGG